MSPWLRKSQDSFPRSFLLMTVFPFSLLEGVDRFSITHPFSGFRFCVINHVSAPKLPSLISITCPVDTRKVHTVPYNELCHHLWDSLAPSLHTFLCNPVGPGQFCALSSEFLALRQHPSAAERVCTPRIICSGHAWCQHVLSLLIAMHNICLFSWYYTYSIHLHQLAVDFTGATHITHKNQNTLHTSKSAMLPADHPSLIRHTYGIHS